MNELAIFFLGSLAVAVCLHLAFGIRGFVGSLILGLVIHTSNENVLPRLAALCVSCFATLTRNFFRHTREEASLLAALADAPLDSIDSTGQTLGCNGIDTPDKEGNTPVHYAVMKGQLNVLEALIQSGSKAIDTPDNDGNTPLYIAARSGNFTMIESLVRLGSNAIDTLNNDGCTPLHAAAWNGHASAIGTLVRLGSKAVDTPDNYGWTPLYEAAWSGHVPVIEALVRLGSNGIDAPDHNGWTPLFVAAHSGHVNVIEALVRLGSKAIDTPNNNGWTPLDTAARKNRQEAVKTLVALGADITTLSQEYREPIEQVLMETETEEYAAEVRYRVYFGESLVHRLLFQLQVIENLVEPSSD